VSSPPVSTGERTLAGDLRTGAAFGAAPGGGVSRFAWTPALAEVTEWVGDELRRLGLEVEIDAAGNLLGKWPAPAGPAVMTASHLDTVPQGGAFDGALGVLAAVEAIRTLREEGFTPARPIWVGAFMDEEGTRFGTALFGSRAFCGGDLTTALESSDADGVTIRQAMAERGFDADRIADADQVAQVGSYVELHIEQGPVLFSRGLRLGLVESIVGVLGLRVRLEGQTNHAGSTPPDMRRDALVGAARVIQAIRDEAAGRPDLRGTVGCISVEPSGRNVIPGRSDFTVDLRPSVPEAYPGLEDWFRALVDRVAAEEQLTATVETDYAVEPTLMDPEVQAAIAAAAADEGVEPLRMVSGGGHDAMVVARHARAGMLFVPSRDGISHSPAEWTDTEDCELGARVLAGTLRRLAS
jgi:hydantoinase/carbamoylase family amidase